MLRAGSVAVVVVIVSSAVTAATAEKAGNEQVDEEEIVRIEIESRKMYKADNDVEYVRLVAVKCV